MQLTDLIDLNATILDTENDEFMCLFDSQVIHDYTEMWEYNRTLNNDKVKEIENGIKTKQVLDTVLYLAYSKVRAKFIVFDGNHRRQALLNLLELAGKNIKVYCYVYELPESDSISLNEKIYEKFKIINKNTPIPEIYYAILEQVSGNKEVTELDKNKRKISIISEVFDNYKMLYKHFYSVSNRCYRPNFNDTKFFNLCHTFDFESKAELISNLNALNIYKKNEQHYLKLSNKNSDKCDKYNFYLFS